MGLHTKNDQMKLNSDKILFTQLGDEGVLYLTDTNEYLSLNETMFFILKAIEEGKDIPTIVSDLCDTYQVDLSTCQLAVENSIKSFQERGILIE